MAGTDATRYADRLRSTVEQLAALVDDLGNLVEECPALMTRTHLRNAVRCADAAAYALASLAAHAATDPESAGL